MNNKDVSPVLTELSSQYNFQETPGIVLEIQKFLAEISRIIKDLLRHLKLPVPGDTNTSALADLMQYGLILAGVLCLILLLIIVFGKARKLRLAAKAQFKGAEEIEEQLDSAGWKKRANELADKTQWNKACRALYLSVLYLLDERKVLNYAPTRSNYEYWYALSSKKSIQKSFRELADLVDLIWFGEYEASRKDFETCSKLTEKLSSDVNYSSS